MAHPISRRWATATVAALLLLTGCGKSTPPAGGDTAGSGQLGSAASAPPDASTTTGTGGGGTGGNGGGSGGEGTTQASPYPSDAKTYGLEVLKAIGNKDNARLAALVDLNTVNYAQQYQNKNAQWTYTDCASGATQTCHYYNQTGDIASVGVLTAKLGQQQAGNSVYLDQGTYPTNAGDYVRSFVLYWQNGNYAHIVSLSSASTAEYVNGQTKPTVGYTSNPYPCKSNSSKTCVDEASELAGGRPFGKIFHFIIDPSKISAGKPNGIIGYEPADTEWRG